MLVAQISDPHINPSRPHKAAALERAVAHLLALPTRPDAVIVTGDCADNGTREGYAEFRALVAPLPMPVYVVPGNHDDRAVMLGAFGPQGSSPLPGFVQYVVDGDPLRLIALDTHVPGEDGGLLDAPRLAWLSERLEEARKRPTLIFMHHPPFAAGLRVMDATGLSGAGALRELISRHGQVERVVAGHTHAASSRRFGGTLAMTCPATDHTWLPDLTQPGRLVVQLQPPLCLLHAWSGATGLLTSTSTLGAAPLRTLHDGTRWVEHRDKAKMKWAGDLNPRGAHRGKRQGISFARSRGGFSMKRLALLSATCALALSACGLTDVPDVPSGRVAYGLDDGGQLVTFGLDNAASSVTPLKLTGLGAGEAIVDLDVFNKDGALYAMTDVGRLYQVNTTTGALTLNTAGTVGFPRVIDFNPAAQRLRVFSTGDMNYRLTPGDGTSTNDGMLAYAATDVNAGKNPNLVAAAYTNSFAGYVPTTADYNPATTLYSIDADQGTLVSHSVGPAFSTLNTVGTLGVGTSAEMTGFDIAGTNEAYLTASMGTNTMLYTLDLATGKATLKSTLSGVVLKAFAVALSTR